MTSSFGWSFFFFLFFFSFVDTGSYETRRGKVNYFTTEKFVIMFSSMKARNDGIIFRVAAVGMLGARDK